MSKTQHCVTAIKAFNDNYIWAISISGNDKIVLVDPGHAQVCIDYLESNKLMLSAILITHHHSDHVGGIKQLLEYAQTKNCTVTVYGPATENIAQLDILLKENDTVNLTEIECQLNVLDLPGHTKGHVAYHNQEFLFCGDTLFSGGCGRLFEGTAQEMHHSLEKLASLPAHTLVYCAHEYTQANLAFAIAVEPNNIELKSYAQKVEVLRQQNQATIPSTIGLEQQINPFLRCHKQGVKRASQEYSEKIQQHDSDVFSVIRTWKNNF